MPICPCCKQPFPDVGVRCDLDGFYSVTEESLAQNDPLLGRLIDDKYIVLKRLGQGGMGSVYQAKQLTFGRIVALKILSKTLKRKEEAFKRFQVEAESVAMLSHPNIVQLYDTSVDSEGNPYIAMECVQGRVLSEIPPEEITTSLIVKIASQILNALEEAHNANIIHRDLKPDNIMLTNFHNDNYFVKILDFGLAAFTDESRNISIVGEALGTPWYMSPEQATASKAQFASDIYSLGCILYELLTSKPPFPGNRPYNVMMQHVNAPVPPIVPRQGLYPSDALQNFILKCLEKSLKVRYSRARFALQDLMQTPEWSDAQRQDPGHSIRLGLQQLLEESESRSGVSNIISLSTDKARTTSSINRTINSLTSNLSGEYSQPDVLHSSAEFATVPPMPENRLDPDIDLNSLETIRTASPVPFNLKKKRPGGIVGFFREKPLLLAIIAIVLVFLLILVLLFALDLI